MTVLTEERMLEIALAAYDVQTACNKGKWARGDEITPPKKKGRLPGARTKTELPTHCLHGHEYTEENTRIRVGPNGTQTRICRACVRIWNRASWRRKPHGVPNALKTRCKNGHDFTPENTVRQQRRDGSWYRTCLTCRRERDRVAA